jgi:hypothetical protein
MQYVVYSVMSHVAACINLPEDKVQCSVWFEVDGV